MRPLLFGIILAFVPPVVAQEPAPAPDAEEPVRIEEEVTVTAGHSDRRIQDVPLRVEVVDREEIEEKALMTPGSVAMLLGETTGLRVQTTAPTTGAANVRIQGLRGRYSLLLSDGLPLYGVEGGSLNLLQVPPLDLGQVEIIKGAASALYGPSALGGVINLVSRRPTEREREGPLEPEHPGGGRRDLVDGGAGAWRMVGQPARRLPRAKATGHGRRRLVGPPLVRPRRLRPRAFWNDGKGRSLLLTAGAMVENRNGRHRRRPRRAGRANPSPRTSTRGGRTRAWSGASS